jgi:hypothetical protein
MKVIFISIMVSLAFASGVNAWWQIDYDTVQTTWPGGNLKEWYMRASDSGDERGFVKHGQYRSWHENGQLAEEGRFEWGAQDGVWITWAENGQRLAEATYRRGVLHGRSISWHGDDSEAEMLYYNDGKLHGLCTWFKPGESPYNPGANMVRQVFYLYGEECLDFCLGKTYGPCCPENAFYIKPLELWIETSLGCTEFNVGRKIAGKKHGKWVLYSSDGSIIEENLYRNDTLVTVD